MDPEDSVGTAAERLGVQQEFWDIFGQKHATSTATNIAILTALGFDCASDAALAQSLSAAEEAEWQTLLPPVAVLSESGPLQLTVRTTEATTSLDFEIRLESGEIIRFESPLTAAPAEAFRDLGATRLLRRTLTMPIKLPIGYHQIRASGHSCRLIVAPDSAMRPAPGKHAGLGVTLYGLRSRRNWGVGDFRDLRHLIDWAVPALHADFIALNPLHAIHNRRPFNTSPYLPNSIFYRNFIYLDIESIPGYDFIRHRFEDGATRAEIFHLRSSPTVEYEQVAALKRRALDQIFHCNPPAADCREWIAAEGELLRLYATWCALDEHLHHQNPDVWVWPDWPEDYRDPKSPAVAEFAREHEREILFHGWVQWNIDRQIGRVQKHARALGMGLGLYHDLALATDSFGSDLWAHRAFYVAGCRVGAPPDDFSPTGQDWSFPPPNQTRHREDGYRLFAESIRKSLRHGGALRIDHVMRLFRLYWIPEGHDAAHGAYVRDHAIDLVRILALESVRAGAVIIGEDLGTVEPEVREILAKFGVLSYRLLIFERDALGFKPPTAYPAQALASSTTHDLPTITGFWTGLDIEARLKAGTIDQPAFEAQQNARRQDKQFLLNALLAAGLLPPGFERNASRIPVLTGELHFAITGYLASTPSVLWLVNQEDLTKEPAQQNLPGTTVEYPNWSRKMRWSLEELAELGEARDCAVMVRNWIDRSGRGTKTLSR